ncbi:MAG: cobalt ECF transporter T component CbiQ [Micrococcales bacterium]|nr:cobalt ECF transporter T component CbiQ [Micrococcales bacterium]
MGAPHGHHLHWHGHSPIHRLPAHVKLVSLLAFVVTVVATPREAYWAFAAYLLLMLGVWVASRVPLGYLARRMVVEVPFVVFALLIPFVATGPRVDVGPLSLSEPGLLAAWGILAKATLGVMASLALATTTEPRDIVAGLEHLRLPALMVGILTFMLRYLDVVVGELERMRIARESRGFRATSVRQWPAIAATTGALFIRSYERGERVHLAMLSRGYGGRMPLLHETSTPASAWARGLALPAAALLVLVAAVVLR